MFSFFKRRFLSGGKLVIVITALALGGCLTMTLPAIAGLGAIQSSPVLTPSSLPATTCSLVGTVRTCDLWVKTGTISLPGPVSVPIWGYSADASAPAQMPGPVLIVNKGETVTINLHNGLAEASSLSLPGQPIVPDRTGAAANGTASYTFTATNPGTSLYQAGLTADGPRQVAMGLFGAIIVRSGSANSAYDNSTSAYDDETVQVFSELDPALNANPAGFDMRKYAPRYWLINGQSYPNTTAVPVGAGHKVLLRYLNAGSFDHSIGSLGLRSQVIGTDGKPLTYPYGVVAETLAAGQTLDLITTIPGTATAGTEFPLYNGANHLDNNGQLSGGSITFGGMLTFLQVDGQSGPPADTTGPATSAVVLNPATTTGAVDVSLSATLNDTSNGNSFVTDGEYFIDTPGTSGTGTHFSGIPGNTTTVNVTTTIPASRLTTLTGGSHLVLVHGQDSAGNWGSFQSQVLYLDKAGPKSSGSLLTNPTNGSSPITIRGTGDDSTTGNSQVTAAEYFIDSQGTAGTGQTLNITAPGSVVELTGTIPVATLTGLSEGSHTVYIHSKDAFDQWGGFAGLTLTLDRTGPVTSNAVVAPNPNNGTLLYDPNSPSIRISATATDPVAGGVSSSIKAVEGFLDTTGAPGSGIVFMPTDGSFNSASKNAYAQVPISTIQTLSAGSHTFSFRAQDAAGNWGAFTTATLIVDKTGPAVNNLAVTPNPTNGAVVATLTGTAVDPVNGSGLSQGPGSNITGAEWFEGADPGKGSGTPLTLTGPAGATSTFSGSISTCNLSAGTHSLSVRAKDAAGNWGAITTRTFSVAASTGNTIFADNFEAGNFNAWCSTTGNGLSVTNAAALHATTRGMAVSSSGSYVSYTSPTGDNKYNARFYFNPNGSTTNATGQVIFQALNGNQEIFHLEYRVSGGQRQVRLIVTRSSGTNNNTTGWYNLTNGGHSIEVGWLASTGVTTNAQVKLYIDGVTRETLTLRTFNLSVRTARLGIISGALSAGGSEYFDEFVSARNGVQIGG